MIRYCRDMVFWVYINFTITFNIWQGRTKKPMGSGITRFNIMQRAQCLDHNKKNQTKLYRIWNICFYYRSFQNFTEFWTSTAFQTSSYLEYPRKIDNPETWCLADCQIGVGFRCSLLISRSLHRILPDCESEYERKGKSERLCDSVSASLQTKRSLTSTLAQQTSNNKDVLVLYPSFHHLLYVGKTRRLTWTLYALAHGGRVVPCMMKDMTSKLVVPFCPNLLPIL